MGAPEGSKGKDGTGNDSDRQTSPGESNEDIDFSEDLTESDCGERHEHQDSKRTIWLRILY